jgi:hypothetical protein
MTNEVIALEKCEMTAGRYDTPGEIESLVRAFEDCTLPKSEWTHEAHLTVAMWYLFHCSGREATFRIRNGIKRFNAAKGVKATPTGGYHETMTMFWICTVSRYLLFADADCSFMELVNGMIERCADKKLPLEYYSRELLMSPRARASWVGPDLRPFV